MDDLSCAKKQERRGERLILLVSVLLLARAFFGFDLTDEAYYLATAFDRAARGLDMSGSYSIHQTSALLTAPLAMIYRLLSGSMQGSLLFFRIAYVAVTAVAALAVYRTIQKGGFGHGAALTVALVFEVFCPLAIPTFSYNTLLLIFLALSLCALFSAKRTGRSAAASGACFAFAAFAYPPAVLCLPVYAFMVRLRGKQPMQTGVWPRIAAGMAASGCMLMLSYAGTPWDAVKDILQNMFKDPEHQGISLMMKMRTYASGFLKTYGLPALLLNSLLFLCACLLRRVRDEQKRKTFIACLCWGLLAAFAFALTHLIRLSRDGTIKISLLMHLFTFAFPILWTASGQKQRSLMLLWALGLVVSVAVHFGTNNGFIVSAYPLIFSSAASLLCADRVLRPYGKWLKAFAALAAAGFVLLAGYYRVASVYRDAPIAALGTRVETGVARGLRTTKENAARYHSLQSGLSAYRDELRGKNMLVSVLLPWVYPETETAVAAPNAWRTPLNSERLVRYYARYPQLIPDAVLVIRDGAENPPGGFFTGERLDTHYYSNELEYGTLYIRNDTAMEGL